MIFRIVAALAALIALGLAAAPASAQTANTLCLDGSVFGQTCNVTNQRFDNRYRNSFNTSGSFNNTSSNHAGNKTTLYAPPSIHTSGNSTAHCVKRWDFSVSAWLAGIGIGIPETDKACVALVARQVSIMESAEERERIALGRAMCADRARPHHEREAVCAATHARVMALLKAPAAPRAEEPTKAIAKSEAPARVQYAHRDEALTR